MIFRKKKSRSKPLLLLISKKYIYFLKFNLGNVHCDEYKNKGWKLKKCGWWVIIQPKSITPQIAFCFFSHFQDFFLGNIYCPQHNFHRGMWRHSFLLSCHSMHWDFHLRVFMSFNFCISVFCQRCVCAKTLMAATLFKHFMGYAQCNYHKFGL